MCNTVLRVKESPKPRLIKEKIVQFRNLSEENFPTLRWTVSVVVSRLFHYCSYRRKLS